MSSSYQRNKPSKEPRQYRRTFSPDFKKQIVELCRIEGAVKRDIADQYNITESTLYAWLKTYDKYGTFDRQALREAKMTKFERLEKRVEHLELENSILKDVALMLENYQQKPSEP